MFSSIYYNQDFLTKYVSLKLNSYSQTYNQIRRLQFPNYNKIMLSVHQTHNKIHFINCFSLTLYCLQDYFFCLQDHLCGLQKILVIFHMLKCLPIKNCQNFPPRTHSNIITTYVMNFKIIFNILSTIYFHSFTILVISSNLPFYKMEAIFDTFIQLYVIDQI